jgi:hypothetical protein
LVRDNMASTAMALIESSFMLRLLNECRKGWDDSTTIGTRHKTIIW